MAKRGMSWVGIVPSYMSVHEAKMGRVEKDRLRAAVLRGLFIWREDTVTEKADCVGQTSSREVIENKEDSTESSIVVVRSRGVGAVRKPKSRSAGLGKSQANQRPGIGPPTAKTPTPTTQQICADEPTRRRRAVFHPKKGIG